MSRDCRVALLRFSSSSSCSMLAVALPSRVQSPPSIFGLAASVTRACGAVELRVGQISGMAWSSDGASGHSGAAGLLELAFRNV